VDERRCKRCEQTLPLEAFNRYKDGHQWWCRECFKAYFRERGELHRQQAATSKRARNARARKYVLEHLRSCACGETDVLVLEFDHRADKFTEVATLVGAAVKLERIEAEIAKCDVVCANCHRRRTYQPRGADRTPESTHRINW
jgi:hypothetical protein